MLYSGFKRFKPEIFRCDAAQRDASLIEDLLFCPACLFELIIANALSILLETLYIFEVQILQFRSLLRRISFTDTPVIETVSRSALQKINSNEYK